MAKLPVPSVEAEWNALVNPEHPEVTAIRMELKNPFLFDGRTFMGRR
jgi:hypothetical protein